MKGVGLEPRMSCFPPIALSTRRHSFSSCSFSNGLNDFLHHQLGPERTQRDGLSYGHPTTHFSFFEASTETVLWWIFHNAIWQKKKKALSSEEEMGAGADPCTPAPLPIFVVLCFCLVIRGRRPNQSTLRVARIFLSPGTKNKTSFSSFQFYFSFASGHLCLWAWKL